MKRWQKAIVGAVLGGAAGYAALHFSGPEEHFANVACVQQSDAFACTVTHVRGSSPVNACWSVALTCQNGNAVSANACQDVDPAGTATRVIQESQFSGLTQCDAIASTRVKDLTVVVK